MGNSMTMQILILIVFLVAMYFLLVRPQKKKEQEIKDMRDNISVGDEIVTIGGIKGKVVKTMDDGLVIRVGADKVKFEVTRWAVSSVVSSKAQRVEAKTEQKEAAPAKPKRLDEKKED